MNQLLKAAWQKLQADQPRLRIRDAASALNVSELELALTEDGSELLMHQPFAFINQLKPVGPVMSLTRNQSAVLEVKAAYGTLKGSEKMALMLGDVDLRVFLSRWAYTLYIDQHARQTVQFFDAHGNALHKVFSLEQTDLAAWQALINQFRSPVALCFNPIAADAATQEQSMHVLAKQAVSAAQLRQRWSAITDVHQFNGLLAELHIRRQDAYVLAGPDFAKPFDKTRLTQLLSQLAATQQEIMLFVANSGLVQIYSGPVLNIKMMGPWLNVLDPHLNLHLNLTSVANAWCSMRPSKDGAVHSLDLFDEQGELVLQLFAKRSEGQPQADFWRPLIESVLFSERALPVVEQV